MSAKSIHAYYICTRKYTWVFRSHIYQNWQIVNLTISSVAKHFPLGGQGCKVLTTLFTVLTKRKKNWTKTSLRGRGSYPVGTPLLIIISNNVNNLNAYSPFLDQILRYYFRAPWSWIHPDLWCFGAFGGEKEKTFCSEINK